MDTTAGAVENFAHASRLRNAVGEGRPAYRYERDVENFFRHSPAVVRSTARRAAHGGARGSNKPARHRRRGVGNTTFPTDLT